ncbi:sulfotransferase family protein [Halochromatium roseum]|uniref:sulfotransferase family protein n=1 Tax=Halochromatium roseum TaxID=391920 RepID=UPI001A932119|nr:sulfotransferase family protein [Halochromatium roseum]MBK5940356.1 sulfotransferase family protein [Halochromatium roseum]
MTKKIFCVGLNKTGTSSLHEAFRILGLKSVHLKDDQGINIKDVIKNNYLTGENILKSLEEYDAFSDWAKGVHTVDIVKEFDKQYPGSKFILNTRDLEGWLNSREKHVKRNQERKQKNPDEDISWLDVDRNGWENQYTKHYDEVNQYFEGRKDDILVFDVTKGDGWEKLCPFLNLPTPSVPFPKKNVAPKKKSFFRILEKIKKHI